MTPEATKATGKKYRKVYYFAHKIANKQRTAEWRKKNPTGYENIRLKSLYGIALREYKRLLKAQKGVCAVCQRPPKTRKLAVDHDHKTKKVRGLLCHICNRFRVGMNTLETALAVVAYLKG